MHVEQTVLARTMFVLSSKPQEYLDRGLADLVLRLMDGRERRMHDARQLDVVEAHHRDVLRDLAARVDEGAHYAERHGVAGDEDRGHARMFSHQRLRQLDTASEVVLAVDDNRLNRGMRRGEYAHETARTFGHIAVMLRAGEMRDAAVAELQQILGGERAAGFVIGADGREGIARRGAVQQHNRQTHARKLIVLLLAE